MANTLLLDETGQQLVSLMTQWRGSLDALKTDNKTSLVAAINELVDGTTRDNGESGPSTKTSPGLSLDNRYFSTLHTGYSYTTTVTYGGDGTFSASSSDETVATASYSNKVLTVTAIGSGSCVINCNLTETTSMRGAYTTVYVDVTPTLEETSWEDIQAKGAAGTGSLYWDIGDTKTITLDGTVGTLELNNFSCKVFIIEFNYRGVNGIYFQGFKSTDGVDIGLCDGSYGSDVYSGKYFNMNHVGSSSTYNTNYGGWKGSDLRYDILGSTDRAPSQYNSNKSASNVGYDATSAAVTNPVSGTLMEALPNDLRNVLAAWTIYTDNMGNASNVLANVTTSIDYLPLLSEFEIQGVRSYANQFEQNYQAQMSYYVNGNSRVKYNYYSTSSAVNWWLRSPYCTNTIRFCYVNANGNVHYHYASNLQSLAPAFRIA